MWEFSLAATELLYKFSCQNTHVCKIYLIRRALWDLTVNWLPWSTLIQRTRYQVYTNFYFIWLIPVTFKHKIQEFFLREKPPLRMTGLNHLWGFSFVCLKSLAPATWVWTSGSRMRPIVCCFEVYLFRHLNSISKTADWSCPVVLERESGKVFKNKRIQIVERLVKSQHSL